MTITRPPFLNLLKSEALLAVREQDAALDEDIRGLAFKRGCDLGREVGAHRRWRR
jgi:hypothetical protein